MAAQRSSSVQQHPDLTNVSAEWKLAEIERLQDENRLLQSKVSFCTAVNHACCMERQATSSFMQPVFHCH
jgi:hypothetical protein